ncbi:hypothetical protein [Acetobacter pasteurianus]|uniref:hypothetical protein n=1 Tax=Acetobacter pasteurianus TaxID=438 RepID=UPI000F54C7BD|nr:hypothetical protein [Acetobacter pasteurianus]
MPERTKSLGIGVRTTTIGLARFEYMILDHKDEGSEENETSSEATWLQKFYDMLAAEYKNVLATKDRNEDRSANVSSWKDCESKKFVESLIAG